jgi:hypothetical protein
VFSKKNPTNDEKMIKNLSKEVETLMKIRHPNTVECI